jgi:serine protease
MKRLALLAVLTLTLTGCMEDEPVSGLCPGTGFDEDVGEQRQEMRAAGTGLEDDGREAVLIRFKQGSQVGERDVEAAGAQVKARLPRLGIVAARLTPAQREALARNPAVERISPDRKVYALGLSVPPPSYVLQQTPGPFPTTTGSVGEETPGLKMVQANEIWDRNGDGIIDPGAPTGAGIKVCIIDSGIDRGHPELQAAYLDGRDFVDAPDGGVDNDPSDQTGDRVGGGHGTHVAGTIAAQFANGAKVNPKDPTLDRNGVVGVAPGVKLLIARALGVDGSGRTSDVLKALGWCTEQGANIVTLSLGAQSIGEGEEEEFQKLANAGILAVAASGNSGADQPMAYPAAYATVMAVGAVNTDGGVSDFSQSFTKQVPQSDGGTDGGLKLVEKPGSLVAPGTVVQSTMIRGHGTAYTEELSVGGQSFDGLGLEYSPLGSYTGRLVDCGLGDSTTSCGESATCDGFVAFVERGGITFEEKAKNAILQGAKAIIFGNQDPADDGALAFTLGVARDNWVPSVAVTTGAAADIRSRAGSEVTLSLAGSDYAVQQGTSMATPHVTAVAALVWSARPSLSASQVRCLLQSTAKDLGAPGYDANYGYGLVQARAALEALEANGRIASDCGIPAP